MHALREDGTFEFQVHSLTWRTRKKMNLCYDDDDEDDEKLLG